MLSLSNYKIIDQVYESSNTLVHRAIRNKDNLQVILKILKEDYSNPIEFARYTQEYEITHDLDFAGIIKSYGIEKHHNALIIILEDFNGRSLRELITNHLFSIKKSLLLAIQIAESLAQLHMANIIHKDINPDNIVVNIDTNQLKIIDLGAASRLPFENPTLKNPGQLEGTLAYISPEQTGRINRSIDYRSDLYSLGATFYELLTGELPFTTTDAMELVHCHIAKKPSSVFEINSNIPQIVSNIVMKLLEKNAEDRYQSARGVIFDLEKCLEHLTKKENLTDLKFELGQNDFTGKLQIPQKLYGRESEISILLQAFERVSSGKKEIMLVAGYSGVGKTALVHEVHKPLTEKRGYFIAGKVDQFKYSIPYYAIANAFNEFCRSLLMESTEVLANRKNKILDAVGDNGQIITDIIPDLELIIGKQADVTEIGSIETRNRFNMVFLNFFKAVCHKDHPLVIFLDDLHRVDSASLSLLKSVMVNDEIKYLLIFGAYRDNEVDNTHPFIMAMNELQKTKAVVNTIKLANLQSVDINNLLQNTFKGEAKRTQLLTDLVYQKTQGNAFFVHQFLHTLYKETLLFYDVDHHQWQWDVDKIAAQNITENVVDLMTNKIHKLSGQTIAVLQLAACVGNQFDLHILSIIYEQNKNDTCSVLYPAITEGLILPLDENYKYPETNKKSRFKFLHDRVQQAAYALIDEELKETIHLRIGRLLLKNTPADALGEKVFNIVGHFNHSIELLKDQGERLKIAQLNLIAGQKAKPATAYESASQYLIQAMSLLPENCWQDRYELTYDIYKESAEVEYVLSHFEQSESLVMSIIAHAKTAVEKSQIYNLLILQYTLEARYEKAIQAARDALELLDIRMPKDEDLQEAYQKDCEALSQKFSGRSIESLVEQNKTPPANIRTALILMAKLIPTAFIFKVELLLWLGARGVDLSLEFGWAVESAMFCPAYAFYPIHAFQDYQSGYKYSRLGILIAKKFQSKAELCRSMESANSHFNIWVSRLRLSNDFAAESIQAGLESGDIQFVSYAMLWQSCNNYYQGMALPNFVLELQRFSQFVNKAKDQLSIAVVLAETFALVDILGLEDNAWLPVSIDKLNEEQYVKNCLEQEAFLPLCLYYIFKLQTSFVLNDYKKASLFAAQADELLGHIFLAISVAEHNFYSSLTLAALYPEASEEEQKTYLQQLDSKQKQMKIWVENCPENFLNMSLLVEAEIARIKGNDLEAMDLYDQAIASAYEEGFNQNEAIGNELCAKFWMGKEKDEISGLYIVKAYHCYRKWGAGKKIEDLEEKYPQFLSRSGYDPLSAASAISSTNELDLSTVIKASQAISMEIGMKSLLPRIMTIMIENAGAQKGILILNQENELIMKAIASGPDDIEVLPIKPVENCKELPEAIVRYVFRTGEDIILHDAREDARFSKDAYIIENQPKSILSMPIRHQHKISGVLYLENNLAKNAFTEDRILLLNLLLAQVAISLENARLFEEKQRHAEELLEEAAERKKAEQKLQLASISTETSMSAIFTADLKGYITYANASAAAMWGYNSSEEMVGTNALDYWTEGTREKAAELIEILLNEGSAHSSGGLIGKKLDGTEFIVESNSVIVKDKKGKQTGMVGSFTDITDRKTVEEEQLLNMQIFDEINHSKELKDCFEGILGYIKRFTGLDAVAIRLQEGLDFPYFVTRGFPAEFVKAEKYLCERDIKGMIKLDSNGYPYIECMCGNILCNRIDPGKDFFSDGGSFWSNHTSKLLAETTDDERQTRTRNRCNSEGYESVALIPIKAENEILGLIQLNDKRQNQFTESYIYLFERLGKNIGLAFSRKKAQEALRDNEKKFQDLANSIDDIFFALDNDLNYTYWNEACSRLFGLPSEVIVGKSYLDFEFNKDFEWMADIYKEVMRTGQSRNIESSLDMGNTKFWYDIKTYPSFSGCSILVKDITERKKSEDSLRENEMRLRLSMNAAKAGSWIWNIETGEAIWDDRMQEIFGFKPGTYDRTYEAWKKSVHPEDVEEADRQTKEALANGTDYDFQYRLNIKSGTGDWRTVRAQAIVVSNEEGERLRMVGFCEDITERKQEEQKLIDAFEMVSTAENAANLGSWIWKLKNNEVEWSDNMCRLHGIKPSEYEATFEHAINFHHPDDRTYIGQQIELMLTEKKSQPFEYRIVTPRGEIKWVEGTNQLLFDKKGNIEKIVGTVQDITERKQAEEQIKASLKEKETLLQELYHRTKNNMQVIQSMLKLHALKSSNDQVQELVKDTENRIQAMALVHQMLYQSKDLSHINAHDYVDKLSSLIIQSFDNQSQKISLTLDIENITILIDTAIPLGLVLNELMSNSLKHAFPDQDQGEVSISIFRKEPNKICLTFSDNGIGVPDEFDFRKQETLGFEMITGIAENQMNGTVRLDTTEGFTCHIEFSGTLYEKRV